MGFAVYAENLGSLSEKVTFSVVAIRRTVMIIFLQKVECKPWLKIFLINETDMGPKRNVDYSIEND